MPAALRTFAAIALAFLGGIPSIIADDFSAREKAFAGGIAKLESRHGGRLGVAALDMEGRTSLSHRGGERFAMCSTFKFLLAAAVAARVDAGKDQWDRKIPYGKKDLLSWAPVTGKEENLTAGSMTVASLCEASMTWSDNTAANLLLDTIGGPGGLTKYLRSIGDTTTRLDRNEPGLNANVTGDERDTTTPAAMVATMEEFLLEKTLTVGSQKKLIGWLVANRTGDKRIRAAMDPAWRVGDKTGTGENGAANDIAVIWPTARKPFLLAVFYTSPDATAEQRDSVIADAAKLVNQTLDLRK